MNTIPLAMCAFGTYSSTAVAADAKVALAGDQEAPLVETPGSDNGSIIVGAARSAGGSVPTLSIAGITAHIHDATAGQNGQVTIALPRDEDTYTAPANAKLSDAQCAIIQAGNLYANVHTAADADNDMRGQLKD